MKTVGKIIKEKRRERGWTQDQLAKKVGVSKSIIGYYERDMTTPTIFVMCDIADLFECTLDELCGRKFKEKDNGSEKKENRINRYY